MNNFYNKVIEELNSYYETKELPSGVVKLNEYETVYNLKMMVKSHLSIINNQSTNLKSKIPYIKRLLELKKILDD